MSTLAQPFCENPSSLNDAPKSPFREWSVLSRLELKSLDVWWPGLWSIVIFIWLSVSYLLSSASSLSILDSRTVIMSAFSELSN